MNTLRVSIIIPAFNEGRDIIPVLERISEAVTMSFECLVVIDNPEDSTIDFVNEFSRINPAFKYVRNNFGSGPANAIKQGFEIAKAPIAVVTMADGSDDPELIDDLVRLVDRGVVIAAGSRYMAGGQQIGAPRFKSFLSRLAGNTLFWFTKVGTHDATNSFKAYDVEFVRKVGITSKYGFELGLELTAKAKRLRKPIAELPTIWIERDFGKSNFKLIKWLPHYLTWYFLAFGRSLSHQELIEKIEKFKVNKEIK